jgi:hypothetical protein
MTDNRIQVFDVAMKNARTIEACVDRLVMMGADHELKLVAQRPPSDLPAAPSAKQSSEGLGATRSLTGRSRPSRYQSSWAESFDGFLVPIRQG